MINYSLLLLLVLLLSAQSRADSGVSARMLICREIQLALGYEFINEGKEIPDSWDDFAHIRMMKDGRLQRQPYRMDTINSFALVPSAPFIRSSNGVPAEYGDRRLFMISRFEERSKSGKSGRLAVFLASEGGSSTQSRPISSFVDEETALLILQQIEEFDPAAQPMAFPELAPSDRTMTNPRSPEPASVHNYGRAGAKASIGRILERHPALAAAGAAAILLLIIGSIWILVRTRRKS